jgi:purine nucleosidase
MPRRIVIDTDPGTDDAVAILLALASPELEIAGLVAVAGNVPLVETERNARAVCELAGHPEVPVYAGCPRPIDGRLVTAAQVHAEHGLGRLTLPSPRSPLQPEHGVTFLIDTLRSAAPGTVTVCALGPLTNIAVALVMAPDIVGSIAELVLMGGASYALGNVTPAAEFNIHADPQAAAIVFGSGAPITMVPLDLTLQVRSTPERIDRVRALATPCCDAAALLMAPPLGSDRIFSLHDPCVIAWLLVPELFEGTQVNVAIETASDLTLGMTVVDWRGRSGLSANARVLHKIDADGFYALLCERLARL